MCYFGYINQDKGYVKYVKKDLSQYMMSLPKVEKSFYDWCKTKFKVIGFYRATTNKNIEVHCECGHEFTAEKSEVKVCPKCKKELTLSNLNKYKNLPQKTENLFFAYLEKSYIHNGIVQRLYNLTKKITFEDNNPRVEFINYEEERGFLPEDAKTLSDKRICFFHSHMYYDFVGQDITWRWLKGRGVNHGMGWFSWRISDKDLFLYTKNLKAVLRGTPFQYSCLDIASEIHAVNPLYYLMDYCRFPKEIEFLYKIGLYGLAREMQNTEYDSHAKKIASIKSLKDLGITNANQIKEVARYNYSEIMAWKEIQKFKNQPKEKGLAIAFIRALNYQCGYDFKYEFLSRESWFNYYLKVREKEEKYLNHPRDFIVDYTDYISECLKLNYDLKDTMVCKPNNFSNMHERTSNIARELQQKTNERIFKRMVKKYLKLDYANAEFRIQCVRTVKSLIKEGKKMRNCSGGYIDKVCNGNSVIFTIKKIPKPTEAYCMLELDPKTLQIKQNRAIANGHAPKKEEAFVNKWLKTIVKKIAV